VPTIKQLIHEKRHEELWNVCCGFIDLNMDEFMTIQERLLLEQLDLLKNCPLGKKIMHGAIPETVDEFRTQVPLTTYADYCPELLERREDVLPAKPKYWQRTSGRSGEYSCKWVPLSYKQWDELGAFIGAGLIFGTCKQRGDIAFKEGWKMLYAIAPSPYIFGIFAYKLDEEFGFKFLPPLRESESMSFEERLEKGFSLALNEGIDAFYGLPGILVAIAEKFSQGSSSMSPLSLLSKPGMLMRLLKGVIKSKLAHRSMLPRDLWSLKFIFASGTDGVVYKNKITDMWGKYPLDAYGGADLIAVAMQTWDYEGMTFFPNVNFLEFIPEEEHEKWKLDHSYQPETVLLNEVKAGEIYEMVITHFHGGALVRYRPGDMIRITALRNEKLGIEIPQMVFERRADDLIDLGLMRLTEKVIWQAIENSNIPNAGWTARKEIVNNSPTLHLYLELKNNYIASEKGIASAVYEQLKLLDDGFIHSDMKSVEKLIDFKPIEVTLLPEGAFSRYVAHRQAEGADLAHLKPPHMNPSDDIIELLKTKVRPAPATEEAARETEETTLIR
jgi:hypothetical protein